MYLRKLSVKGFPVYQLRLWTEGLEVTDICIDSEVE